MKFFHVYNEDCFKGLEKNGMLNKNTGFKIQHFFSMPVNRKFNEIAKIGGPLHSMIKKDKIPFYIDRYAGGGIFHKYDFDKNLIKEYEDILGDWFLGFQIHESGSNRRDGDWQTILRGTGHKGPYTFEELDKLKSPYAKLPDGTVLHQLSHGSVEEYAKLKYAETAEEFSEEMRQMYIDRMNELGRIVPVDSYYLMTKIQDEIGVKTFMPEVGSQIPEMRLSVALARGIAEGAGKTWGTYYECWHSYLTDNVSYDCGMPCFNLEPINEWYLTQEIHPDNFTSFGANGGSSRLLQNRIYYHSLMSGAHYIGEEWGLNCSYYDMKEFTLSPYGQIKKDFINETADIDGVKAEVPFAFVVPNKYNFIQIRDMIMKYKPYLYLRSELPKEEYEYYRHIDTVLGFAFERSGKEYGNEGHVIANSHFGDVFDVIYEDASEEVLNKYEYLIDTTPDSSFAKKMQKTKFKVIESTDYDELIVKLKGLIKEVMPVYVSDLCWLVSHDDKGRRYLSIFNNEGNIRNIYHGDFVDPNADRTVDVTFKVPTDIKVFKEGNFPSEITKISDTSYKIKVPATAFIVMEF